MTIDHGDERRSAASLTVVYSLWMRIPAMGEWYRLAPKGHAYHSSPPSVPPQGRYVILELDTKTLRETTHSEVVDGRTVRYPLTSPAMTRAWGWLRRKLRQQPEQAEHRSNP